jgi:hypothetical protein
VRCRCMEATSQTTVAHWGILPSTWRAATWVRWDTVVGWLGSELDIGPKSNIEVRELFYTFHLWIMVIRSLQQRLINPQVDSVSELTTIKCKGQNLVKPKSKLIQIFVCSSPKLKLQLL